MYALPICLPQIQLFFIKMLRLGNLKLLLMLYSTDTRFRMSATDMHGL